MDRDDTQWATAGLFLDALARRDFAALESCLEPDVRFRALVPKGPIEEAGAAAVVDRFRTWFGTKQRFELVDAAIGQIGGRAYIRWRLHTSAPDDPSGEALVEQHVFVTGADRIDSLDLLCSGFQVLSAAPGCALERR